MASEAAKQLAVEIGRALFHGSSGFSDMANAKAAAVIDPVLTARDREIAEWKRTHHAREEQAVIDRSNIQWLEKDNESLRRVLRMVTAQQSCLSQGLQMEIASTLSSAK